MSTVQCQCGSFKYRIELKSNNQCAYCTECGKFIKNIPFAEPKLYIGKYKDIPIKDVMDAPYLTWALANLKLSANMREAVTNQIQSLTLQS